MRTSSIAPGKPWNRSSGDFVVPFPDAPILPRFRSRRRQPASNSVSHRVVSGPRPNVPKGCGWPKSSRTGSVRHGSETLPLLCFSMAPDDWMRGASFGASLSIDWFPVRFWLVIHIVIQIVISNHDGRDYDSDYDSGSRSGRFSLVWGTTASPVFPLPCLRTAPAIPAPEGSRCPPGLRLGS